ncbi:probable phosphatase phospho2 [Nilaparvata lugens]|uniref:probable phosphatase phospho2 n=1 Tax=Nilaparvata lugens TaxID=108931 RepID=UPI00193DF994|nr:probable phosphatase phospho2 [Nilaparvata lugens]XP_039281244.1 probable phosphatase phospho2 [Nilaparvata lugens]
MLPLTFLANLRQHYTLGVTLSRKITHFYKYYNSRLTGMEVNDKVTKDLLVAFDFDHTLVDDNSDTVARSLLSTKNIDYSTAEKIYKDSNSWTSYMIEIFRIIHENSITGDEIVSAIHRIPPIAGMEELLKYLSSHRRCEMIIISDSNSVFIDEWLKHKNLSNFVRKVFTNPAFFDTADLLNIEPYQNQDFCKISERNLCKGHVLETYISDRQRENVFFNHLAFVGDGSNDLCPSLRLSHGDFIFPRENYALSRKLSRYEGEIKADIHPWTTGNDVLDVIQKALTSKTPEKD